MSQIWKVLIDDHESSSLKKEDKAYPIFYHYKSVHAYVIMPPLCNTNELTTVSCASDYVDLSTRVSLESRLSFEDSSF